MRPAPCSPPFGRSPAEELEFAVAHTGEERMPLAWVEYERGSLPVFGVADTHTSAGIGDLNAAAAVALHTRSASP
jgi:hypothetical protein